VSKVGLVNRRGKASVASAVGPAGPSLGSAAPTAGHDATQKRELRQLPYESTPPGGRQLTGRPPTASWSA
jgi:hypothetical protein